MNAAARVTIASLLSEGSIERVPVDEEVVTNLLRQAGNHLRTAAVGAEGDDAEGAFQLAYDADVDDAIAIGDELIKTLTPAIEQILRPPS